MRFVFPCKEYEQKAIDFVKEFRDYSSELHGSGGLESFLEKSTYSDWLAKAMRDIDIANIPVERVPQFVYFYVREEDDEIIGMLAIRTALTDFLRNEGGHIGYCIRPTERCKGYGTEMLKGTLAFCGLIGLHDIIISCDKENNASAGVIKNCGGVLDDEFYSETFHVVVQRYKIVTQDILEQKHEGSDKRMLFRDRYKPKISSQQLTNGDLYTLASLFGVSASDTGLISGASSLKEITVYTCIKILSEAIGKLPLKLYKRTNNDKEPITGDYRCFLLSIRPNPYMSAFDFWRVLEVLRNIYGNSYAYIDVASVGRNAGKIQGLYPLNSERMKVYVDDMGLLTSRNKVWYQYQDDRGTEYLLNSDSVLHFKGLSTNGLIGLSTIEMLRATIENAKASSTFLNNSYKSGMQSAGVLQYTGGLSPEGERVLREKFEAMTSGLVNANRLAVMPIGLTYQPLSIKLTDAQFLENTNFTIQQLTAAFGIRPHQVNDQTKTSYASTAEANREFYTDTLLGILTMYEQENTYKLFTQRENESGWYAKFDTNVILRADTEKRFAMYKDAVQNMLKTPNECRALEEDGPQPGGDILYGNAALAPATLLAEGGAFKNKQP